MAEKNAHENHRQRMQERVQQTGLTGLAEHEALEYLLFFALPRRDTNPIAHALIERFGSFNAVLEAREEDLATVPGVGPQAARLLHVLLETSRYYALHQKKSCKPLNIGRNAEEYIRPYFTGLTNEAIYLITLDNRGFPLRTVKIAEGAPNRVPFDASQIARAAVQDAGCANVILAHNHPHGLPAPSFEDMHTTEQLCKVLGVLGVDLFDHIIVADEDSVSLRATGRMPDFDRVSGRVVRADGQEVPILAD